MSQLPVFISNEVLFTLVLNIKIFFSNQFYFTIHCQIIDYLKMRKSMSEVVYNFYFEQLIKKIVKPYLRFLPITIHFFAVGVFASVVPNFGGIVVNMNLAEGFVRLFLFAHNKVVSSVVLINIVSGIFTIKIML